MIRVPFPNGWYCDARGDDFVVLIKGSHLATSHGRVELPRAQNLLFVDLAPDGVRFAGVGNRDDLCWEWDGSQWHDRGEAFGPRAVMYDSAGGLHIVPRPTAFGYRYQAPDGRMVTASETQRDLVRRIWEYTELGDGVTIGQGGAGIYGEDPAIVLIDDQRRLLEAGTCRFIKARRFEDGVSIAFVREDIPAAVLMFCTLDELRALPPAVDALHPQPPAPVPVPQPTPGPPEPIMEMPADVHAILAAVATKFKTMHQGDPPARREATKRGIATIRARVPNSERYVWKTDHPSMGEAGASKDAVGFVASGPIEPMRRASFVVWDTINGATREMFPHPLTGHLVTAHMIPVEPFDWLAGEPQPKPKPDEPEPAPPTKTKDEIRAAIVELKRFYDEPDGLNRKARGIPSPISVDDPAFFDWVALAVLEPIEQVKERIRQFPEYKDQHR